MSEIKNDIGTRIKLLEPLGKGGYGSVYKCTDEFGTQLAIKCIDTDTSGIPCLMETSIMSTIVHPHLHRAIHVHILPRKLYIISEMAISDMSKWTRKNKKNHRPTFEEIRLWSHSLIQAVACLHRQSIIHCDIKSSNVLIFADGSIKLTDYTLSVKKWSDPKASRRHNICTCTHRPLEVWLNRDWDFPVDIWSLGCTLVEIALGELLFPYQGPESEDLLREKTVNCLLDWGENGPEDQRDLGPFGGLDHRSNPNVQIPKYKQDFEPFRQADFFTDPEYAEFKDLVLPMLRLDPNNRPTIFELIKAPLFEEKSLLRPSSKEKKENLLSRSLAARNVETAISPSGKLATLPGKVGNLPEESLLSRSLAARNVEIPSISPSGKLPTLPGKVGNLPEESLLPKLHPSSYSITSTPMIKLTEKEVTRLKKQIFRFTGSSAVLSLAIELYGRCTGLRYIGDYLKLSTCLWIAGKLILRTPITTDVPLHQVLSTERTICTYLSFRLHLASNPSLILI